MASLGEKFLTQRGIEFTSHEYDYQIKGAKAAAEALHIPVERTVKTLVVLLGSGEYIFLLMPGHGKSSMKTLARTLQVKSAELAKDRDAERLTGYQVGGIGPFGSRTSLPVYMDIKSLDYDKIYINGGRRGLLLGMDPEVLVEVAQAELVDVSLEM